MNYWTAPALVLTNTDIVRFIANQFNITYEQIISKDSKRIYSDPRLICYYILSRKTKSTYPEIGKMFGKGHPGVHTGANNVKGRMEVDKKYREKVNSIINKIKF